MKKRRIGSVDVAEIGFGCMGLNHAYGTPLPRDEARQLLLHALELGVEHIDTAALYGFGSNEELVGEVLAPFRGRIFLASKCGMTGVDGKRVIDGRPETLKRTCQAALGRLRTDVIDLYYLHRWDKRVPIEDSVGALADMVAAGHVRAIGLSEVSAETLRRAHAVHPIAAVQNEYSLWTRDPESGVLDACRTIGAAFVAFAPLGRGFLADRFADPQALASKDLRRSMPRFQEPHFSANRKLVLGLRALATEAGCTPAQLALAWLLRRGPHIVPIAGTTSSAHLDENVGAATVELDPGLAARLDGLVNARTVSGPRYPAETMLELDTVDGSPPNRES